MSTEQVNYDSLLKVGLIGIVAALVTNVILFFIGDLTQLLDSTVINPLTSHPIGLLDTIVVTLMASVGGIIVFGLLTRYTERPVTYFRVLAGVVFLIELINPWLLPEVPVTMVLFLYLMHVVTFVAIAGFVTIQVQKSQNF